MQRYNGYRGGPRLYEVGTTGPELFIPVGRKHYDIISGCPAPITTGSALGQNIIPLDLDIEALADKLWEKIYSKPAIVPCPYCKSRNAITNPICVQCGGPLGE